MRTEVLSNEIAGGFEKRGVEVGRERNLVSFSVPRRCKDYLTKKPPLYSIVAAERPQPQRLKKWAETSISTKFPFNNEQPSMYYCTSPTRGHLIEDCGWPQQAFCLVF